MKNRKWLYPVAYAAGGLIMIGLLQLVGYFFLTTIQARFGA